MVPGAESRNWKTYIFINKLTGSHFHRYQHKYQHNILLGGFNSQSFHIRHILCPFRTRQVWWDAVCLRSSLDQNHDLRPKIEDNSGEQVKAHHRPNVGAQQIVAAGNSIHYSTKWEFFPISFRITSKVFWEVNGATLARDFISGYLTSIALSFQQMLGEYRCRHTRNAGMPGDEQSLL